MVSGPTSLSKWELLLVLQLQLQPHHIWGKPQLRPLLLCAALRPAGTSKWPAFTGQSTALPNPASPL